ncbi:putative ubiquitin-like-specific protease 1B isoform X2 [Miscanthus floridulus]|uniref:putative ubiquitin-like-specific protease 1B isoform X2 n=1 Tax=Miscanthus floridulus TaxID=154761 RepID=UPI003457A830
MTNVINAYITLLRAQDHLKLRACGKVLLENSLISSILKRDGDDKIKMEDLYPTHDENGISTIEQRVLSYLDHDMVFIPINIEHTHWYLAVVNAKEYEIQVLDSMGTIFGRQDLILTIKEMQKQIDIVSQHKNLKDHKWPNIQVSSWPVREIHFEQKMQTDGMLNTGLEKVCLTT